MNVSYRKITKGKERKQQPWRKIYKIIVISVENHK